jgi:hypothetical protein
VPLDLGHFVTLDRFDALDRVGAEVSHFLRQEGEGQFDTWRLDAHGQFVDDKSGVGAYFTVPIGRAHQMTHVGDVEVGLLYMPELAPDSLKAVLHFGLGLPTTISDTQVPAEASTSRIADTALSIPRGTTARIGGSLLWNEDVVFARGDLALDANLDAAGGRVDPFVRGGAGFGIIAGAAALMAEANVIGGGQFISVASTGALSVRLDAGPVQIYGAYVFGLDGTTRNVMHDAFVLGTDVPL